MQKLFGIGNARTGVFAGNTGDRGRIECLPQRQIVEVTGRGQHANQLGRSGPQITGNEDRLAYGLFANLRMRSEEHTSELQSLMRISYAVFCLKKTKNNNIDTEHIEISIHQKI